MRILQGTHHFLPRHRAGVEVYTDRIARALLDRGHEVAVVTTDDDGARRAFSIKERVVGGLPVFEIAHPRVARTPDDSLGREESRAAFESVLDRFAPDLVHFQHLMYLGLDAADAVAERGIPIVMTLHEYWLLCARGGQMLRADGSVCERAVPEVCATCLSDHRFGRSEAEARVAALSAWTRRVTGWDPFPSLKRAKQRRAARKPMAEDGLRRTEAGGMLTWLDRRERRVRALLAVVDRFLCPSRFLMQQFVDAGWPADRLHWSPNGTGPLAVPARRERADGEPLRITFMGSIVPHKGADVLVEAFGTLPEGMATLELWGSMSADPAFADGLRAAAVSGVTFRGAFPGGGAAAVLAATDVVVVPSVWFENAPVVISEAFACGVPVVASGFGGMAEMVDDSVDGRLFEPGSANDLARVLHDLAADEAALRRLARGVRPPRTVADDVNGLETLYAELAGAEA